MNTNLASSSIGQHEAICINVDTGPVTALALLSLRRFWTGPVRVVDCSRKRAEQKCMHALAERLGFKYECRPLKKHGDTLDDIFLTSHKDGLLLMDSDVELLSKNSLECIMSAAISGNYVASGFIQKADWAQSAGMSHAWYASRIWMPLAWFKVKPVKALITSGGSFRADKVANDFPSWPRISKALSLRSRLPWIRGLSFRCLQDFRLEYEGQRPTFIYRDTGAEIYRLLKESGEPLFGADWHTQLGSITHLHGVTRSRLSWAMPNSMSWRKARRKALRRLSDEYAFNFSSNLRKKA